MTPRNLPLFSATFCLVLSCVGQPPAAPPAATPTRQASPATPATPAPKPALAAPSASSSTAATAAVAANAPTQRVKSPLVVAIERSAAYLTRATRDNGRFVYLVNLDPAAEVPIRYNVLRHAGTLYALTQVEARWPQPRRMAAIKRSLRYLRRRHFASLPGRSSNLAVWSTPVSLGLSEAKLGGAGLTLLASVRVEQLAPGTVEPSDLTGLAQFIAYMQKPDGQFYSKFYTDGRGRSDAWTSLYYPGEAAFGMSEWYAMRTRPYASTAGSAAAAVDGERVARRALLSLARQRRGQTQVAADHWALLATAAVLRLARASAAERTLLVEHCVQIVHSILTRKSAPLAATASAHGSLPPNGRITPTATRLEGLLAALSVLPAEHSLRPAMLRAIHHGVAFLFRAQVKTGPHRGGMPRDIEVSEDERSTEVRIDYVQHTLSAWVGYWELTENHGGSR